MAQPGAAAENREAWSRRCVGAAVMSVRVGEVTRTRTAVLVSNEGLTGQLERDVWL